MSNEAPLEWLIVIAPSRPRMVFSDETLGSSYASLVLTAKRELIVRRERFLAATNQKPQQ